MSKVVFFAVGTKLATLPQLLHCFSSVPELGAAAMINEVVGVRECRYTCIKHRESSVRANSAVNYH